MKWVRIVRKSLAGVLILGVSLILSSVVFGIFFYQSRVPDNTIKVVGTATKRIDSDVVKWRLTLSRSVSANDLKNGYAQLKGDLQAFRELLASEGIPGEDLTVSPVNTNPVFSQYEKSGTPVGYSLMLSMYLVSHDLAKVERLALNPSTLVEKGMVLQGSNLEYYSSRLGVVKKELLAEATKDAQQRAEVIARSTGDRIAKIDSARVGVFQITEPYSTEVSDYGIYNTGTRRKDITVTMNVSFTLK